MKLNFLIFSSTLLLLFLTTPSSASLRTGLRVGKQCGKDVDNKTCPNNLCCSKWGFCGSTDVYCGDGCQSQCDGGGGGGGDDDDPTNYLSDIFDKDMFDLFLLHRNDVTCPAKGFYEYSKFIEAAKKYPQFAKTGDDDTRKREIAAFFAQTSHETTGNISYRVLK